MEDKSLNLKIQHSLTNKMKLQTTLSHKTQQVSYYQQIAQFLHKQILKLQNQVPSQHKKALKIITPSSKMQQLKNQAICWRIPKINKTYPNPDQLAPLNNQTQSPNCKISQHLKYILNKQAKKQQDRIQSLKQKKTLILHKISKQLQNNEPYVWQKILKRIQKQAKKQGKKQVIKALQKIIKEKSGWLDNQKNQIDKQYKEEKLQKAIQTNLLKMKEIGNKKLAINQQIRCSIPHPQKINKKKQRMKLCSDAISSKLQQYRNSVHQKQIKWNLQATHRLNDSNDQSGSILGQNKLRNIRNTIQNTLQQLSKPLQAHNCQQLEQQLQNLSEIFVRNSK